MARGWRRGGSRCSGEVHGTWFEGKCRKWMKAQWAERKGLEAAGRLEEKEREGMASSGDRRGGEDHGGGDGGDSWWKTRGGKQDRRSKSKGGEIITIKWTTEGWGVGGRGSPSESHWQINASGGSATQPQEKPGGIERSTVFPPSSTQNDFQVVFFFFFSFFFSARICQTDSEGGKHFNATHRFPKLL